MLQPVQHERTCTKSLGALDAETPRSCTTPLSFRRPANAQALRYRACKVFIPHKQQNATVSRHALIAQQDKVLACSPSHFHQLFAGLKDALALEVDSSLASGLLFGMCSDGVRTDYLDPPPLL